MHFNLAPAPRTCLWLMTIVFSQMLYNTCLAYLDDIIIFRQTFKQHLQKLECAILCVPNANFKFKPSKCRFEQKSVKFFNYVITDKGINPDLINSAIYKHGLDSVMKTRLAVSFGYSFCY